MGGFNDKEQANVEKFFRGKSGSTSRQSMVENLCEKKISGLEFFQNLEIT